MSASLQHVAEILPFRRVAPPSNRMSMRDRMEALRWSDHARDFGYTRVVLDTSSADDQPELGDFLLIYARDATWATWGVGCCGGGFTVWRPASGETVGWYRSLRKALDVVPLGAGSEDGATTVVEQPSGDRVLPLR